MNSYVAAGLKIIEPVGTVETVILAFGIGYAIYLWVRGVLPALLRLGNGLAKRKIAIFAKQDNLASLKHLLTDSKLFRERNICEIGRKEDFGRADKASVYLVLWPDWTEEIDEILNKKSDNCPLIVSPPDRGRIPDEQMKRLDGKRNTAVTNFRGRLLNDIVTAMITTSYDAR
jgi:hypothetical protein